jgi:hypothetical protein
MQSPITCVSGFWNVENKYQKSYVESWLHRTLRINNPYVIYCNDKDEPFLKSCRGDLPTVFVKKEITDFVTYKHYNAIQTNPRHVPSKELQLIWNEKLFLLRETARSNPFNSDWFLWMDAGLFLYRDKEPPKETFCVERLKTLPKDRLIFSSSDSPTCEYSSIREGNYYHYVSGIFMIHKDFVEEFVSMYEMYIDKLLSKKDWIYTDQVILTHMYKEHPEMFYWVIHDYAGLVLWLYRELPK